MFRRELGHQISTSTLNSTAGIQDCKEVIIVEMSDWSPEYNTDYAELVRNYQIRSDKIRSLFYYHLYISQASGTFAGYITGTVKLVFIVFFIFGLLSGILYLPVKSSLTQCFSADDNADDLRPLHVPRISEPARFSQTSIAESPTEASRTDGEANIDSNESSGITFLYFRDSR